MDTHISYVLLSGSFHSTLYLWDSFMLCVRVAGILIHWCVVVHYMNYIIYLLYRQWTFKLFPGFGNYKSCYECLLVEIVTYFSWVCIWSRTSGSQSKHMLSFRRYCQTVSQSNCIILHPHQQCLSNLVVPHPRQLLVLSVSFHFSHYSGGWLYFTVHFPDD